MADLNFVQQTKIGKIKLLQLPDNYNFRYTSSTKISLYDGENLIEKNTPINGDFIYGNDIYKYVMPEGGENIIDLDETRHMRIKTVAGSSRTDVYVTLYDGDNPDENVYSVNLLYGDGSGVRDTKSLIAYMFIYIDDDNELANIGWAFFPYSSTNKSYYIRANYIYVGESNAKLYNFLRNVVTDSTDPFDNGGDSTTGGGTGDFDNTSDSVDFPDLPTLSAVDTGLVTLYNPTLSELKSLAQYLWTTDFYENILKLWADPMNVILGLSIVPCSVPDGGQKIVAVGNVNTDVSMTLAASQYQTIDCGSLNLNEYWGAYLDYAPYTSLQIYLPYCGVHPLDINECMDKKIHVKYNVDLLSGSCVAMVKCGESVLYTFQGQCASNIPVTGENFARTIQGALSIAASIGTTAASGGLAAPLAVGSIASTASTVASSAPQIEKSGAISSSGGLLAIQKPYLILSRPNQCAPKKQNIYTGYPSFITKKLSDVTGYTEVEEIRLTKISGTDDEKAEILELLKGGVIL